MTPRRLIVGSLSAGVILAGAVAIWATSSNFHSVIPGQLYRSAQLKPGQLEDITKRHGIRTIVNLRGENTEKPWYQDQRESLRELGLAFHDVTLSARAMPDITELAKLIDALKTARRPILVHCLNGADRSGLASALALLMDGSHELAEAKRQTSLFYRVIYEDSAGRQFLRQYESWLAAKGQEHAPDRLLAWIRNDYDDHKGNLRFFFDGVNDRIAGKKQGTFRVDGNAVRAFGWIFDLRRQDVLGSVTVLLDGKPLETRYRLPRKDVAQVFGIPAVAASGWEAKADLAGWPRKCYGASLRVTRLDNSAWESPPLATICLN